MYAKPLTQTAEYEKIKRYEIYEVETMKDVDGREVQIPVRKDTTTVEDVSHNIAVIEAELAKWKSKLEAINALPE